MSVHLVGGGWSEGAPSVAYAEFLTECAARAEQVEHAGAPRIAVVVVRDGDGLEHAARLVGELTQISEIDEHVTVLVEGFPASVDILDEVDGVLIGGGLTPAYHQSVGPLFDRLREVVSDGVPYLGFSAGAMIAAERALLGGWRIGGVAVAPEEASEELDEITIVPGIGLVDLTVDVHTAQWGTLSRLVASTAAGVVDGGVAIDEGTSLIVGASGARVVGSGSVWRVAPAEAGAVVSVLSAVD
ncbi:Type 1 glutamine amidotransferase-like domain-containing protein [Amnibacterium flavum]|uniref:Peptidase S51 n=1 Tax=Amnibacterium flavum TaxID=2173173 RepID=A0A2V1HSB0_9MICO|nr:Type 1 glutamine amidotransferase-like domain-containing protein [Amnibacterium flavum]PVZ93929.1 peptidase S51 [Amnibacterium flavum]